MTMALMFIGGSPGSTAGGVKTTTFAILVLAVLSVMRGAPYASVNKRRITHRTVYKATAVTACGFVVVALASTALLLTQDTPFMPAIFEVMSALGTVGLSMGATAQLDAVGKLVIIFCMFAGRVGPLTLLLALREPQSGADWGYPEEGIPVG
jgi:trk system potassium uptake protein TrkH